VIRRSPLQAGALQRIWAAKRAQPPTPSQAPVVPQVAGACIAQMLCGSGPPTSVGQQVPPRPCWSQLTHGPLQATLQQTPSAQNVDLHSLELAHTAPLGFRPQLPFTHTTPLAQSVLDRHVDAHLFAAGSQLNGAQIVAGPARQPPWPSQTLISLTAAPLHVPALHSVPAGYLRQCPWPSHVPSSPQVETAPTGQAADCSIPPFGTNVHIPGALWSLHVLHDSVHVLSQQTPSTQKPVRQSPLHPHAWPFALRAPASAAQDPSIAPSTVALPPLSLPQPPPHPVAVSSRAAHATRPKNRLTRRPYRPCQ